MERSAERDTNSGRVTSAADRCKFQKGRSDEEDTILRAFADRQSPDARVCGTARRALARGESQRVVWQAAMAGRQQLHSSHSHQRTRDVAGRDIRSEDDRQGAWLGRRAWDAADGALFAA